MALHMMIERIRPDEPSSAPAIDQQLVVQREPHGAGRKAGVGVQQRDHRGHVGAADGDDQQHAEQQRQAGEDGKEAGVGGHQISRMPSPAAMANSAKLIRFWLR